MSERPPLRLSLCFGLFALASLFSIPCSAQLIATDLPPNFSPSVAGGRDRPDALTLTLSWSTPVRVSVESEGGELVLRVDQPLDQAGFIALAPRISPWVPSLLLGYDSLVMHLTPGLVSRVKQGPRQVVISLILGGVPGSVLSSGTGLSSGAGLTSGPPLSGGAARRRLRFLKAILFWSMGDLMAAARLLEELDRAEPGDSEILAARSLVESRLGRWREASAYQQQSRGPHGEDDRAGLPIVGDPNSPEVHLETLRDSQRGVSDRLGLRLGGHGFVWPGLRLFGDYAQAWIGGDVHHRGQIGARYDLRSGSWASAGAFLRPEALGALLRGALWDQAGVSALALTWREPRWELPSLAAIGAVRDAIELSRTLRAWSGLGHALRGEISGRLGLTLERWRGRSGGRALSDVFLSGALRYTSWMGRPRLWGQYAVAHLQPLGSGARGGALGAVLGRSHLQSLTLGAEMPLWRWLKLMGSAGYAWSLWAKNSVLFDLDLAWRPARGLQAQISYRRGLSPTSQGEATDALTMLAGWVF